MDDAQLEILLVPLALAGFVGFWCLILKLLSLGGWGRLARAYPASERPDGVRFRGRSARMGGVRYSGCLTFIVVPEGLYIATMFMFRPGHPPLLVPWSAIDASDTAFEFTEQGDLALRMHASLGRELIAARKHLGALGV